MTRASTPKGILSRQLLKLYRLHGLQFLCKQCPAEVTYELKLWRVQFQHSKVGAVWRKDTQARTATTEVDCLDWLAMALKADSRDSQHQGLA